MWSRSTLQCTGQGAGGGEGGRQGGIVKSSCVFKAIESIYLQSLKRNVATKSDPSVSLCECFISVNVFPCNNIHVCIPYAILIHVITVFGIIFPHTMTITATSVLAQLVHNIGYNVRLCACLS